MARYTFTLSKEIKGMAEWNLEHYHDNKKSLEQYKNDLVPSITQKYAYEKGKKDNELTPGLNPALIKGTEASRPTENAGMLIATSPYILHTERSVEAVERALLRCDDTEKKLVDLVYWKRSHTIIGAGMRINLSRSSAYRAINNILCYIAVEMGYVTL